MMLAGLVVVALMALGLPALVLGLPGLWLMVAGMGVLSLLGFAGWIPPGVAVAAVLLAELVELGLLNRFGKARGATRRAFWGAVAGGFVGIFVGVPVPLVGSVVAAFLGTFLGALAVTLVETRSLAGAARVGWGMVLARTAAVAVKVGTGAALLAWALLLVVRTGLGSEP